MKRATKAKPPAPPPPWRVLAKVHTYPVQWFTYRGYDVNHTFRGHTGGPERAQDMKVIEHDRNDPEAVAIIRAASEPARDGE